MAENENLNIWNQVKEVPQEAQKKIKGGRLKGMTDINPMWRLLRLTELYGPCGVGWYYEPIREWTEQGSNGQVTAFVNIALFIKVDGEWSKPIYGGGGSMLVAKEKEGLHTSDEAFKMATTDAISVACKMLGVGANIYFNGRDSKYFENKEGFTPEQETKYNDNDKRALMHNLGGCKTHEQIDDILHQFQDTVKKCKQPDFDEFVKTCRQKVENHNK